MEIINSIAFVIGCFGALVIVWGSLVSAVQFCTIEWGRFTGKDLSTERNRLRHTFSVYLLTGLEYMIGADVVRTLIRPSVDDLIVLGSMVAIRTVISYFLNREMKVGSHDS